jgi:hypothetical protein
MKRIWAGLGLAAAMLSACGDGGENAAPEDIVVTGSTAQGNAAPAPAAPPPPMDMADGAGRAKMIVEEQAGGGAGGGPQAQPAQPGAARQIAYSFYYTLFAPTQNLEALFNAQKTACERAGPAQCYVVSSSMSGLAQESAYGQLQVRASADWIRTFRDGLEGSLEPYGASIDASTSTAEDLTTQIIDTSARLNSAKTLRDRLQKLLAERPGKLAELIEIERELARVQADIDATESVLAAMRLRVAMSDLTINYQARYSAASESIWRPLEGAFANFLPNVAGSLAGIVSFISETLLWIVFLGGLAALVLWRWRKRRPRAAAPERSA